jgi:hypothetical protein
VISVPVGGAGAKILLQDEWLLSYFAVVNPGRPEGRDKDHATDLAGSLPLSAGNLHFGSAGLRSEPVILARDALQARLVIEWS